MFFSVKTNFGIVFFSVKKKKNKKKNQYLCSVWNLFWHDIKIHSSLQPVAQFDWGQFLLKAKLCLLSTLATEAVVHCTKYNDLLSKLADRHPKLALPKLLYW